jgi:hypothetical protein
MATRHAPGRAETKRAWLRLRFQGEPCGNDFDVKERGDIHLAQHITVAFRQSVREFLNAVESFGDFFELRGSRHRDDVSLANNGLVARLAAPTNDEGVNRGGLAPLLRRQLQKEQLSHPNDRRSPDVRGDAPDAGMDRDHPIHKRIAARVEFAVPLD